MPPFDWGLPLLALLVFLYSWLTSNSYGGIFAGLKLIPLARSRIWPTVHRLEKERDKGKGAEFVMPARDLWLGHTSSV